MISAGSLMGGLNCREDDGEGLNSSDVGVIAGRTLGGLNCSDLGDKGVFKWIRSPLNIEYNIIL